MKHAPSNISELGMGDMATFSLWLHSRGSMVLQNKNNEWEVMRFLTPEGTGVIYRNRAGKLSYVQGAKEAMIAFLNNNTWRAGPRPVRGKLAHLIDTLIERDGPTCWYCDHLPDPDEIITLEHLVAKVHGGPDHISNLVLACQPCNKKAGHLSVSEKVQLRESKRGPTSI